jgi:hypothetical protein
MAKSTAKTFKHTVDRTMAEYIRLRDYRCVQCGSTQNLNCGHVFSRIMNSTRFLEENANCQCATCNKHHEYNAKPYYDWYVSKFGQQQFEAVNYLYWNGNGKIPLETLKEINDYYRSKIKALKTGEDIQPSELISQFVRL